MSKSGAETFTRFSRGNGVQLLCALIFVFFASLKIEAQTNDLPLPPPTTNFISMMKGNVEVARAGTSAWSPAQFHQVLQPGDRVRTGERSIAEVFLAGGMTIRKDELSELEIPPTARPSFLKGLFDVVHRNRTQGVDYNLHGATAGVRGTDFLVKVDESGRTELTVLDGEVVLRNGTDQIQLTNRQRGIVEINGSLHKTAVIEAENDLIQWSLYYAAVLDVSELHFAPAEEHDLALSSSLQAYRAGDLTLAVSNCPWQNAPVSDAGRVYRAALLLSVGQVEKAKSFLSAAGDVPAARALKRMIAVTKGERWERAETPVSSTEWLVESYAQQAGSHLEEALRAARMAQTNSTNFGFAWERVAELEFSFGRTARAKEALKKALQISPRNAQALALKGFLFSAENRITEALNSFDEAIAADSALGNAWLGRGLCRIRQGHSAEGLRDILIAASLEPQRSVLRSYLGKAFTDAGDKKHANRELQLARQLDAKDPTSWLYSALLKQEQNRINEAVGDLETSQELNNNRSVFRSRLLLDEDRAVRSASLAEIYQYAGLQEMSVKEAGRAVNYDYANSSAHQFLAESYNLLSDPNLVGLRYETATFSEYLLANLLAPPSAGTLSQNVSQQEYSKLFERDRFGATLTTTYLSRGDWQQEITQFATQGNTSYALDGIYRSFNGERKNNGLQQYVFSGQIKQQLGPDDSIYFQSIYNNLQTGDVRQYYSPAQSSPTLHDKEEQSPDLLLGYHHTWSPGVHTLVLAGRLSDKENLSDTNVNIASYFRGTNGAISGRVDPLLSDQFGLNFNSQFTIYTAELQQIFEFTENTVIAGARFQTGKMTTTSSLDDPGGFFAIYSPQNNSSANTSLERVNAYTYDNWRVFDSLILSAGVSFDHLQYPVNIAAPPITSQENAKDRVSPKAGFIWTPDNVTAIRGAYTRSLGGLSFDQSVRLEPTQVAGFNQAFRSLIPESIAGEVPGAEFETFQLGVERKFSTRTYLVLEGEILKSRGSRNVGIFDATTLPATMAQTSESLPFEEDSLSVALNQLIDDEWSIGSRYRLSQDELKTQLPAVPASIPPNADNRAVLHQVDMFLLFNHPSGFFAEAESLWWAQKNSGYSTSLPGSDFWQVDLIGGYRFRHRRGQITAGVFNLANHDYHLNSLNLYAELPHKRVFTVSFTANF